MQHDYIEHFFSKSIHRSIENRYIDRSVSILEKRKSDSLSGPKNKKLIKNDMQHDYIEHFFQNRYIDRSKIDILIDRNRFSKK